MKMDNMRGLLKIMRDHNRNHAIISERVDNISNVDEATAEQIENLFTSTIGEYVDVNLVELNENKSKIRIEGTISNYIEFYITITKNINNSDCNVKILNITTGDIISLSEEFVDDLNKLYTLFSGSLYEYVIDRNNEIITGSFEEPVTDQNEFE